MSIEKNGIALCETAGDTIDTNVDTLLTYLATRPQFFQKNITSAANAGAVDVATITGVVQIESIVVRSKGATTGDLTSIEIKGGTTNVVVFIDSTLGAKANIDAQDEQVAWTGAVELPNGVKIQIVLSGGGGTAVDLQITIKYFSVSSGSLA